MKIDSVHLPPETEMDSQEGYYTFSSQTGYGISGPIFDLMIGSMNFRYMYLFPPKN
jgi:hypothetical protein